MPASAWAVLAARPVLTAVLGALSITFSGILFRFADVTPATAAIFRCAYALPWLIVLTLIERRAMRPRPVAHALLIGSGLLLAVDLVAWHHTIELVGAGLATVLGNTQVVFVAVIAWLALGERPAARTVAAMSLVLAGVVLISGVIGSGAYGRDPALGVALGLLTGVAYAGSLLLLRRGNADGRQAAGPLLELTAASAVGSLLLGLPLGEVDLLPTWPAHGWLALLALSSQVVGWLLITISLPRLPAALTSVVLTLQPLGAVIFSMLLLAEAPSGWQLVGAGAILAGLVLATAKGRQILPPAEQQRGKARPTLAR